MVWTVGFMLNKSGTNFEKKKLVKMLVVTLYFMTVPCLVHPESYII